MKASASADDMNMSTSPYLEEEDCDQRSCMGMTVSLFSDFYKFVPRNLENVSPVALSLGLTLMQNVVDSFSHYLTGSAATNQVSGLTQRFSALAFRNTALTDVLQTAYDILKKYGKSSPQARNDSIQLIWNCLSFDFEGTGKMGVSSRPYSSFYMRNYIRVDEIEPEPDDLQSDVGQIPFPKSWERFFKPGSLMESLMRVYFDDPMAESSQVTLECVLQMVCVRRDVFEQGDYLKLDMVIYYDPLLINADGESKADGTKVVEQAIKEYIENIPFNGEFRKNELEDAIQAVDGVVMVEFNAAYHSETGAEDTYDEVVPYCKPASGYFKFDNADLSDVTYQPYAN